MENGNVKPGDIRTVCHGDVAFPLQEITDLN